MTSLDLDINLVNPVFHERCFNYPGGSGLLEFPHIANWRDYLLSLKIRSAKVPTIHTEAYHAALRMMLLTWVEYSAAKSAELQALRSLESALTGAYMDRLKSKNPKSRAHFSDLLEFSVKTDDLPETFALKRLADGHIVYKVEKKDKWKYAEWTLPSIRNALAHGDIFNNLPWGGLFEAVREVMEHAYRNHSLTQTGLSHD